MNGISGLQVDLRQLIIAMEAAVSLVGMDDRNHGKRVGYIASQLGKQLEYSDEAIAFAFELGLLHDCGVSTAQMHSYLVNNFNGNDAQIHCENGHRLLNGFKPLAKFATPVLYHHTPWEELERTDVSAQVALMANLIFISDRIDVLAATHSETDSSPVSEKVVSSIAKYSGTYFEPSFVWAFKQVAKSEVFWTALEERHVTCYTRDMGQFDNSRTLNIPQLKQFALLMADIVAQRSPFTDLHSVRVANLAKYLAVSLGVVKERCEKIEIACLLHDLGKRYIPDTIVEQPGTLTDSECAFMKQCSYETYEILRHVNGLEDIASWSAFHHVGLDGVGHPFYPYEKDSSIEARIIAVADVFQELVQDRMYQEGMSLNLAIDKLDDLVIKDKLDSKIVILLKQHADECFDLAKGQELAQCEG